MAALRLNINKDRPTSFRRRQISQEIWQPESGKVTATKFLQYGQYVCKVAVIVLGYSVIVSSAWAQNEGIKSNTPVPKNGEIASSNIAVAQSQASDGFITAPVEPRSTPNAASESPNVREIKVKENTPAAKLELTPPDQDYVIGPQDLLAINVWHEPELSRSVPVRPDGKISLPLVGEFNVSGLTPRLLESHLAKELENYVRYPQVTVMIQEANSHKFYVIGEIERPGAYPLTTRMTVLNALATAGGFRDFAKVQHIYLLRPMPDGSRKRLQFDYKAVVGGKNLSQDIELQTGDTVVVP
jgi:polysaccharide biosynthesis/export protein